MCAAAGVGAPEQLGSEEIQRAVQRLFAVFLSESAFVDVPPYKRFATSTMAMIFPNSPLPQASYRHPDQKRRKYREFIEKALGACVQPNTVEGESCFVCGNRAAFHLGIDAFPLMASRSQRNFHPLHHLGEPLCAFCALAVQFLPFSLMQTRGEGGKLWFIHTLDASIAVTVAREFGIGHLSRLVAAGEPLRFYGTWACPGEKGAIVSLLSALGEHYATLLESARYPVSAFLFSNDMREQSLQHVPILHQLLGFFNLLQGFPEAARRFRTEILQQERLGTKAASEMLQAKPLIGMCLLHDVLRLFGGWTFHRLYGEGVLGMGSAYLDAVEHVAQRIVADERSNRHVRSLRSATTAEGFGVLLDLVRDGLMNRQELYLLTPPGEPGSARQAIDYLLGAIYALSNGEQFEQEPVAADVVQAMHPLIERIEEVGRRFLPYQEAAGRLTLALAQSRNPQEIRRAFLRLVESGGMRWQEFVFFCPPDDATRHFQSRDYWLAFLYDHLRERPISSEEG